MGLQKMTRHSGSTATGASLTQSSTFRFARSTAVLALATALLISSPTPSSAADEPALATPGTATQSSGGLFTARRSLGAAFLAGGAYLVLQGNDFKDEADRFYDRYEAATDPDEIDKFYQRTTNRDVKSQVSWALAAAFGVTGLRLILTGNDAPSADMALDARPDASLSISPAVTPSALGLRLQRRFF